ncbi:MAG TPA: DUF4166 domain-containing protein [Blastocatellia bacterium]|nr:DUF4166 domain-containing protein [Blastocatellia bacterium]
METFLCTPSELYPKLLGTSWPDLDVAIRRLHDSGRVVHADGVFQVRHGSNGLARTLARLARLPAAGEAVDVRLQITKQEEGEEWRRTFAGRPLVSAQSNRPDGRSNGVMVERMGIIEMGIRLEVGGGALNYQTVSAALRLGSLRVPLPRWLSPYITAWERAVGDMNQIHVSVEVTLPLLGRLIAYDGILTQIEAQR